MSDFVTIDQEKYSAVIKKLQLLASFVPFKENDEMVPLLQLPKEIDYLQLTEEAEALVKKAVEQGYFMGVSDGHRTAAQSILEDLQA